MGGSASKGRRASKRRRVEKASDNPFEEEIRALTLLCIPPPVLPDIEPASVMIKPGKYLRGNAEEQAAADTAASAAATAGAIEIEEDINEEPEGRLQDWIIFPDRDQLIHISTYLGEEWVNHINLLHNIPPANAKGLRFQPHVWQAKGAAQGHYLCEAKYFKGFFCGDEMGLGKTLLAVLMMKLAQPMRGICIVVAPKTVCSQWLDEINCAFVEGETLHAIILTDPKVSAHQLYAIKPDVVIVSFEFVEHAYRRIRNFTEDMSKGRPNSPLHSDFWNLTDWPIKRLFIDEAQRLGNTRSATFTAVKAIPARATALFSGTFPHMKWDAWAGPVSFLKHQPFTSLDSFNRVFATFRSDGYIAEEPEASRMALLQRFLLRFTIARPASVLELKGTDQYKGTFSLRSSDLAESEFHFDKYIQAQLKEEKENKSKAKKRSEQSITKDLDSKPEKQDSPRVLVHATRAQLSSMHYLLMDKRFMAQKESRPRWELDDGDGSDDDEYQDSDAEYLDPDAEYLPGDTSQHSDNSDDDESSDNDESSGNDEDEGKLQTGRKATENDLNPIHETVLEDKSEADLSSRKGWLKYIEDHPDEVLKSGRIREVLGLYRQLCEKYPDRKICICSQYLKFLDLVRVAMLHKFSVEGLEYNGVLRDGIRQANLAKFKSTADCSIPLLLSGKAGGKGINIPEASIMIQTEVWWNRNAELQLYSRMLRPGQKHEVIIIRVEGKDCSIESYIIGVQLRKKTTNTLSMHPLVRPHDQAPEIPPMLYHLPSGPTFSPSPSRDSTTSS